ncbi:cobW domain-containing protein [Mycena indigotica]|uniref:CobW domain-containing protein n=1 Tax=Mycena indigotica TaxID=2126181 RepID=A0A8H6W129_9AGAR|nr:cobW domain-containing protein [Mycena indigotica]KAF7295509.1 cobW domain-containing protein [Mycena indigotica]
MPPITVFTGFLGAGKTSIILSLLPQLPKDYKVVLLKNEFGDIEVDSQLAKQSSLTAVSEILNGCMCCVLVGQMQTALLEIREKFNPDRIIIECSGSAFPATLAFQIRELEKSTNGDLKLDAIVTVIDAENFTGYEDTSPTARMQASYTDIILVNKWEDVTERALDTVMDHLYTLNELTPKIRCQGRQGVDPKLIFGIDTKLFAASEPPIVEPTHNDEVETVTIFTGRSPHQHEHKHAEGIEDDVREEDPQTIDEQVLSDALAKLSKESVWRIKGFIRLTGKGRNILNWAFGRYELTAMDDDNAGSDKPALSLTAMGERAEVRRKLRRRELAEPASFSLSTPQQPQIIFPISFSIWCLAVPVCCLSQHSLVPSTLFAPSPMTVTMTTQLPATNTKWTPPPGRLGNLTSTQEAALAKIKSELQASEAFIEARHDDATLLRFLRARKFDVQKAKEMLLKAEKWRKEFKVAELVSTFDFHEEREVDKYYPQYYHAMDKSGRPVYIECIGNLNMKALYACTTQERLLQHLVVEYESFLTTRLPACSAAVGHPVETSLTILDLGGVSLSNFIRVKDYVNAATTIGQNYYPELMGAFYIINAPWAFTAIWSVIKKWLDEQTVRKVHIVGGPSVYRPLLLEQIDKEMLPQQLGGECVCEGGCSMSDMGPWNPKPHAGLEEKEKIFEETEVVVERPVEPDGQVLSS